MYPGISTEVLDDTGELHKNTYNTNYYPAVHSDCENVDVNLYQCLLPSCTYYPHDDYPRDLKYAENVYGTYCPLMESYPFNPNLGHLTSYSIEDYNRNNTYDLNNSFNCNKNCEFVLEDNNMLLNIPDSNNAFDYNQSVECLNNLYETQFLPQLANNCMHELYETARYVNGCVDNCNTDHLISTMPYQSQAVHSTFNHKCESPDSTDSGTEYEDIDISENGANVDFLRMSEKTWKRYRLSGMFKLGNKGRSQLKSKISKYLKQHPQLRNRL